MELLLYCYILEFIDPKDAILIIFSGIFMIMGGALRRYERPTHFTRSFLSYGLGSDNRLRNL